MDRARSILTSRPASQVSNPYVNPRVERDRRETADFGVGAGLGRIGLRRPPSVSGGPITTPVNRSSGLHSAERSRSTVTHPAVDPERRPSPGLRSNRDRRWVSGGFDHAHWPTWSRSLGTGFTTSTGSSTAPITYGAAVGVLAADLRPRSRSEFRNYFNCRVTSPLLVALATLASFAVFRPATRWFQAADRSTVQPAPASTLGERWRVSPLN